MFTVIDQNPAIIDGTLRENIDPTLLEPEENIYALLNQCHLSKFTQ
jgi:ABC-type multidrug transport system fused ATPase/permease subunit